jgi:hypothetical protein
LVKTIAHPLTAFRFVMVVEIRRSVLLSARAVFGVQFV